MSGMKVSMALIACHRVTHRVTIRYQHHFIFIGSKEVKEEFRPKALEVPNTYFIYLAISFHQIASMNSTHHIDWKIYLNRSTLRNPYYQPQILDIPNFQHYHRTDHYNDVIMSAMASQITSLTIVYSTVYSGTDQTKHQSTASLAFMRGIHRWPVNSRHKGTVTRELFAFDDVIMQCNVIFICLNVT